ncbi:MAG: TatD family hydrolase [Porticoccaceae bacterium]|nr:TatD family hydrolase [Pseudomonadales bacterium]MCP5171584.1 TatD family hydrolase [Pseudomonadales bacterium]
MLVDSHCHLDHLKLENYNGSLDLLLEAARNRGITQFLSVGVNLEKSRKLIDLAEQYPDVSVSIGVHPLQQNLPPLPEIEELLALGGHQQVMAIGETGLDNFYSADTLDWQRESFIRHLKVADQLNKPVIVHTREARKETLDILRDHVNTNSAGVLHCFTETLEMAQAAMELNFYISFSGIITFNNASELRDVVKHIPIDRILVETDSPWLAPVPFRGKQNEPQYVLEVAQCVADIKGLSLQEVAEATSHNFNQLFSA